MMEVYFGVATNYDANEKSKRDHLDVWEGAFMSSHTASGVSLPKGDGYMLATYNGDKVRVTCPTPRTEATYQAVDQAINAALNAFYALPKNHRFSLTESR